LRPLSDSFESHVIRTVGHKHCHRLYIKSNSITILYENQYVLAKNTLLFVGFPETIHSLSLE